MAPRVPDTLPVMEEAKWVKDVKAGVSYDVTSARRECHFKLPQAIHDAVDPELADQRDSIMLDLMFNITCMVLPSAVLQFYLPAALQSWGNCMGVLHLVLVYVFFTQRFILMLHYSEHRRLFKANSNLTAVHGYAPYVLCPFFGIPAGCYRLHHVVMHHLEDNMFPEDLSSTMPYQRDNFLHFLHYWARFCFGIHFELPFYAFKAKRYQMAAETLVAHVSWLSVIWMLYKVDARATTYVLIVPFFVTSVMLMFGNWSQHIFVDPERPEVDYALTYNCINHVENLFTFNDGYHVVHHINSRLHWSEMPQRFLDELPKYAAEGAITFNGLHFFEVGLFVMTGQWSKLYKNYVHLSDEKKSEEEVVAMLKQRLLPCKTKAK